MRKFREWRLGELRRISLPRNLVNSSTMLLVPAGRGLFRDLTLVLSTRKER
jgi:hypothetical protein